MEKESTGRGPRGTYNIKTKTCAVCGEEKRLSTKFFRKIEYTRLDGTTTTSWLKNCMLCTNHKRKKENLEYKKLIQLHKDSQFNITRNKAEIAAETKERNRFNAVHFGHKSSFYWEIEDESVDPEEKHLKYLLSLKPQDLEGWELLMASEYEY